MTRLRWRNQQGASSGGGRTEGGLSHRGEPAGGPLQVVERAQGGGRGEAAGQGERILAETSLV